ncbi:uncharacterized protein LOC142032363 [Buteo buteo]|uniref:uncharacterized protein LOC142032363 n=1 Tax=Buteo buteo TaxID=30397 RepID=UPI003EC112CB
MSFSVSSSNQHVHVIQSHFLSGRRHSTGRPRPLARGHPAEGGTAERGSGKPRGDGRGEPVPDPPALEGGGSSARLSHRPARAPGGDRARRGAAPPGRRRRRRRRRRRQASPRGAEGRGRASAPAAEGAVGRNGTPTQLAVRAARGPATREETALPPIQGPAAAARRAPRAEPSRAGRSPGVRPRCAGAGRYRRGAGPRCAGAGPAGRYRAPPDPVSQGRRPGVTAGTIPRGPGRPPPPAPCQASSCQASSCQASSCQASSCQASRGSGKGQSCPGPSSAFPPASLAVALAKSSPVLPPCCWALGVAVVFTCGSPGLNAPWRLSSQKSTPALREEFLTLRGHPVAACSSEDIRPAQRDSDSAPKRLTLVGIASSSYGAHTL